MSTLRIVTGHDAAGLAELQTIGAPPGAEPFTHTPGFAVARVWHTRQTPVIEPAPRDEAATRASVAARPGETMALMVTFPPDAALAAAAIDPQQAAAEFAARVPGLAEAFESGTARAITPPTPSTTASSSRARCCSTWGTDGNAGWASATWWSRPARATPGAIPAIGRRACSLC